MESATFDIVIASHVIEHQPDLVSFFQSVGKMLKPDGLLSLAVPDKRFCFDYFMPLSLTGDVLEAFSERRTRHANKSLYNGTAYHALADGAIVWFQLPIGRLSFISGDVTEAGRFFDSHPAVGNSKYVDTHAWYFTPSSFRLVIHELQLLKLVDFAEEDYFPPVDVEFFISLRRGGANPAKSRMELLKQMLLEVREQTDFLVRSRAEWPQPNQQCPDRELELERELASLKEMNRRMAQEIDRWNHKPWYSRAIHKIRLRAP